MEEAPEAPGLVRVRYALPVALPHVSIVIPTRDYVGVLSVCIHSLLSLTTYPAFDVVIIDNGTILTNLHVVSGARRVTVTFFDGSESDVELLKTYPENDLAVIRAKKIPDDLEAATLGSTSNLRPGDEVVAIGFPFGIGPSTSAGVVSGLDRSFRSPQGKQVMTGLIQFDAAVNPGNSGGPLISMDGEVIGIVTALLNPTPARTFIGIGFAATIESAGSAVGIPPF